MRLLLLLLAFNVEPVVFLAQTAGREDVGAPELITSGEGDHRFHLRRRAVILAQHQVDDARPVLQFVEPLNTPDTGGVRRMGEDAITQQRRQPHGLTLQRQWCGAFPAASASCAVDVARDSVRALNC